MGKRGKKEAAISKRKEQQDQPEEKKRKKRISLREKEGREKGGSRTPVGQAPQDAQGLYLADDAGETDSGVEKGGSLGT